MFLSKLESYTKGGIGIQNANVAGPCSAPGIFESNCGHACFFFFYKFSKREGEDVVEKH